MLLLRLSRSRHRLRSKVPGNVRRHALVLCLIGASACADQSGRTDEAFLKGCWGATNLAGGTYQLSFEALVIEAPPHGGIISSRSEACPEDIMIFATVDPTPAAQLEPVRTAASKVDESLGQGIRGTAIVVPEDRKHEQHLRVRLIAIPQLELMSSSETANYVRRWDIG